MGGRCLSHQPLEIAWSREEAVKRYETIFEYDIHVSGIAPVDPKYNSDWIKMIDWQDWLIAAITFIAVMLWIWELSCNGGKPRHIPNNIKPRKIQAGVFLCQPVTRTIYRVIFYPAAQFFLALVFSHVIPFLAENALVCLSASLN